MYKNLLNLFVWQCYFLLAAAQLLTYPLYVKKKCGNCIVKWEMAPLSKGNVKVYASTDPDFIPKMFPLAMADIST